MPPAPERYWSARAQEQGTGYWDDRAELDPLAAVIDPEGSSRKNAYVHALHTRALRDLPVRSTDKVLDFGCGTGRHLASLARRAEWVTGADTSPAMVKIAAEAVTGLDNCSVVLSESGRVPVSPASQDLVLTVLVLQMFGEDPEKFGVVAAEITRVLRSGGLLAMIERVEPAGSLSEDSWRSRLAEAGLVLEASRVVRRGAPTPLGRLMIAGTVAMRPGLLSLDEPLNRLGEKRAAYVERLMIARRA